MNKISQHTNTEGDNTEGDNTEADNKPGNVLVPELRPVGGCGNYGEPVHIQQNTQPSNEEAITNLTYRLLKDEKMPIDDFIKEKRESGMREINIVYELIKSGYKWEEILNSPALDGPTKSWLENQRQNVINNILRPQIFRFESEEEIYEKFLDIVRESLITGVDIIDIVGTMPLKRAITMDDIRYGEKKLREHNHDASYVIKLSGKILDDFDRSNSKEVFNYISFDDKTFSQTSKEHLPEGYNPNEVFEKGKSIGLGIDDVHKMGYTGKGVSVAICDWQLKPHDDIQIKEYVVEDHASKIPEYFHASAVSSILVGKKTGIAPESDLYFFAEKQNFNERDGGDDLKSAFNGILEQNKKLPDDKKIRVVSISGPLYGKGTEDLVKKLENSGVWVLDSSNFWKSFGYLEKKDPMGDPNDFDNYQHCLGMHKSYPRKSDALFVNSGDRTLADPRTPTSYRHDTDASASWAIPVVVGYYALACQADPNMTPKKFKKLARETSHEIDSTIRNEKNGKVKRSERTTKIKVIDIKALIQKIEEEKNK